MAKAEERKLLMSDQEIARSYRTAKNKSNQIGVLSQLNACTREDISEVLLRMGELKEDKTEKPHIARAGKAAGRKKKQEKSDKTENTIPTNAINTLPDGVSPEEMIRLVISWYDRVKARTEKLNEELDYMLGILDVLEQLIEAVKGENPITKVTKG